MTRTKALWFLALLILAVVVGSSAAFSYPTLQGPTGLVLLPDANVEPRGSLTVAADFVKVEADKIPSALGMYAEDLDVIPVRLVWGVSDTAELWTAYTDINNSDSIQEWAGGFKLQIHNDEVNGLKTAVGAGRYDVSDTGADVEADNIYAVVTKESARWKGSLGLTYTKFKPEGGSSEKIFQPFVGLEIPLGPLCLIGEYRTEEPGVDDTGMWSAGARYMIGRNLTLQGGVTTGAILGIGARKTSAYYGFSYTLGGGRGDMEEEVY